MTQFSREMLPPNITSVEALIIWCGEVMQKSYPNATAVEFLDDLGNPVERRVVESGRYFYTAADPPEWRYSCRFTIKLGEDHQVSGPAWIHALSVGDKTVPLSMRAA